MHALAPYWNLKIKGKNIESLIEIRKTDNPHNVYVFVPMAYCGLQISDINTALESLVLPSGNKLGHLWSDLVNPNSPVYEQQIAAFNFPLNSITYAMRISPAKAWKVGFCIPCNTEVYGIVVHINEVDSLVVKAKLIELAHTYVQELMIFDESELSPADKEMIVRI